MAELNADLSNYDAIESDLAPPIPPGDYDVEITGSRLKPCKTTGRQAAEFEFVVLGPYCRGARLWDSFTLEDHTAMRRFKTLAVAAGRRDPDFIRNTEELHGLRCRVRVERTGKFFDVEKFDVERFGVEKGGVEKRFAGSQNVIANYCMPGRRDLGTGTGSQD